MPKRRITDPTFWEGRTALSARIERDHYRFPGLESLILFGVTALLPGLSNAAIGALTTALTGLATTAITTGIQMLLMPRPPRPQDGKAPRAQAMPYIIFGVGTNRVGGSLMLWESKGLYLHMVSAFAGHRVSAIQRYYLHDDEVTLDVDQFVEEGEDGRYSDSGRGLILWRHRLGLATETPYPEQVADFSGEGLWTNDHRGDGQASYAVRAESVAVDQMQQRFPHQIPQPSIVADMALVWDFRDDEQDPEDEETWVFSKNPALCFAWWLCFCPYGPRWDYTKALLPVIERWKEEADICDEPIALAVGGTEPRYSVDGWATTETDPIAILNSFLASCDGHIAQHGDGTLILTVGKFREELVERITDADIVGHFIQYDVPEEDEINRLLPKFTYPATDYTTAVADFFENTADQLLTGRVLAQDAELGWVQSWRQARRLTKREWLRIQEKKSGSFDLRLSAINAVHARWIRVESTYRIPSLNNAIVENRRAILALQQGGFQMEWRLHPEDIDAWNPATDEGAAPPVPNKPDADELIDPTIDTVTSVANGSSVYIRVVILDPNDPSLTPMTRYRVKDIGGGTPGAWVEQSFPDAAPALGLITLNTNPVPTDQLLQVQAAFLSPGGTKSDWAPTTPEEVTSTVNTVAPGALSGVSVTGGLGKADLAYTTSSSLQLSRVGIYRAPVGVTLDRATHLVAQIAAVQSTPYTRVDGDNTRTNLLTAPNDFTNAAWGKANITVTPAAVVTLGHSFSKIEATASAATTINQIVAGAGVSAGNRVGIFAKKGSGATHLATFILRNNTTATNLLRITVNWDTGAITYNTGTTGATMRSIGSGVWFITLEATSGISPGDAIRPYIGADGSAATAGNHFFLADTAMIARTASCAPAGAWDYYLEELNSSGVPGTTSGPHTVTIV